MIAGWHRNVACEGVWPPSLRSHSWQSTSQPPAPADASFVVNAIASSALSG